MQTREAIITKEEAMEMRKEMVDFLCKPLEHDGLKVMCFIYPSNGLYRFGGLLRTVLAQEEPSMDITGYIGNMKVRDYEDMRASIEYLPGGRK